MGMLLKLAAVVLVIGGIWVWFSGNSVTREVANEAESRPLTLTASAILAPGAESGTFDQEGTIVLDRTQGSGVPYLLYTEYGAQGAPSIKTKRLIFRNQDACADVNLPCATAQPGVPVREDEKVRVVGTVRDDTVEVSELYRL